MECLVDASLKSDAGIKVDKYFASEIDKHAIKVSKANWNDITPIGDVTKVSYQDGILKTEVGEFEADIDLVIAGSPCQGFSMAGKQLAFDDPRSSLYFKFEEIIKSIQKHNPSVKFLLENVKMKQEYKDVISSRIGVEPIAINSALVSAQNRYRLYWSNLKVDQPEDIQVYLKDILEDDVDTKYYIKGGRLSWLKNFGQVKEKDGYVAFNPEKAKCLTVRSEPSWNCTYVLPGAIRGRYDKNGSIEQRYEMRVGTKSNCLTTVWKDTCVFQLSSDRYNNEIASGLVRKLTPVECERLQTVPDNYTQVVSDSQRYKMLGNGWTVDVIVHILKGLKDATN